MSLKEEMSDGVLILTLDRAEQRNALDETLLAALSNAMRAALDQKPKGLVIAAEGPAFCAGIDMGVFAALVDGDQTVARAAMETSAQLNGLLAAMPCPTIAAVNGLAAGPGIALALACDLRVVSSSARFRPGFFRFGGSPDGGVSIALVRAFGYTRALAISVLDSTVSSDELVERGLAERADEDNLVAAALSLVAALGGRGDASWPRLRQVLDGASSNDLVTQLDVENEHASDLLADPRFLTALSAMAAK